MTPRLVDAGRRGAPSYLETTDEENGAYYRRAGFDVVREAVADTAGPRTWSMPRPPQG